MKILIKNTLFSILILVSSNSFSSEPVTDVTGDQFYEDLLNRHVQSGHLSDQELVKQKYYHSNQKSWQGDFKNQVRGVASTLKSQREILKFKNPPIEISIK
ncbi:MAG: hypothetical protein ACJAS4_003703 [Bacteriovoracaceae bacterium]|jgi:hypothetical protein